jgi:hypothetical protein
VGTRRRTVIGIAAVMFIAAGLLVAATLGIGNVVGPGDSAAASELQPPDHIGPGACIPENSFLGSDGPQKYADYLQGKDARAPQKHDAEAKRAGRWLDEHHDYYLVRQKVPGWDPNSTDKVAEYYRNHAKARQITEPLDVQNHYCDKDDGGKVKRVPAGSLADKPMAPGTWVWFVDDRPIKKAACGNDLLPRDKPANTTTTTKKPPPTSPPPTCPGCVPPPTSPPPTSPPPTTPPTTCPGCVPPPTTTPPPTSPPPTCPGCVPPPTSPPTTKKCPATGQCGDDTSGGEFIPPQSANSPAHVAAASGYTGGNLESVQQAQSGTDYSGNINTQSGTNSGSFNNNPNVPAGAGSAGDPAGTSAGISNTPTATPTGQVATGDPCGGNPANCL